MDQILNNKWEKTLSPFTGVTLYCDDFLEIDDLRKHLEIIYQELKKLFPKEPIFKIHDWHEHDGYISNRTQTHWNEIENCIKSNSVLYESRSGDDFVRVGIYPKSCEFYLRYYLPDENDDPEFYPGFWGDFDITFSLIVDAADHKGRLFLKSVATLKQCWPYRNLVEPLFPPCGRWPLNSTVMPQYPYG